SDIKDLPKVIRERRVDIAVISVPAGSAQDVANLLVVSGIKAILNFAPCHFNLPKKVKVSYVDLTAKLMQLVYYLK
ncbi:MAG: redox-sensing transcriptional repressor Rex, partial [Candidatus Omnitrophica bacterium]|nr:redox-sensing transcriptional repressor Rex [Candidatus Omnitrophota bacterium]